MTPIERLSSIATMISNDMPNEALMIEKVIQQLRMREPMIIDVLDLPTSVAILDMHRPMRVTGAAG